MISLLLYLWHKIADSIESTYAVKDEELSVTQELSMVTTTNNTKAGRLVVVKPMKHVPLNEIYPDETDDEFDSFEFVKKPILMIDTNGCKIPIALVPYNRTKQKLSCGKRAVFLKKTGENKIQATIKLRVMKKYLRRSGNFSCCYKFFSNPIKLKDGSKKSIYTKCKPLNESVPISLRSEFITVKCFQYDNSTTYVIYKDAYAFVKKINTSTPSVGDCKERYNILIIGIDSMSLSRFEQTMPQSTDFLKDNNWLGYRAFNKIEAEAFPNLIATITGLDMTDFSHKCGGNITKCNKLFLWSKFKEAGYMTAFAEDFVSLPEMFSNDYEFGKKPTDHYPRALFLNEELVVNDSLVCAGRQTSGEHILNYAIDFALTYRNDSFFGLFWIHSFSHSLKSPLVRVDKKVENFLNQLTYTGVLRNTFVVLLSAHGILVGRSRFHPSSFYDERMPILFMMPASTFKIRHPKMYSSAIINQARLVTPFDIYNTIVNIKDLSLCKNLTRTQAISKSCPKCQSLIETIDTNRTCSQAAISEKWCTCRKMYLIDTNNDYGVKSVLHVVSYITSMIQSIETEQCWNCTMLSLKDILRIHFYYDESKVNLFYVVAFRMLPDDLVYEATVAQKMSKSTYFEIVGPVSLLTDDKSIGNCTKHQYARPFCLCAKNTNC
ncbi:uncharacterized protein LOC128683554 isoform X2 [Plodia interpunctella]|nr:uncharacterized protein LOC128683554 isoform X2 [Plodia interpunctella]